MARAKDCLVCAGVDLARLQGPLIFGIQLRPEVEVDGTGVVEQVAENEKVRASDADTTCLGFKNTPGRQMFPAA